MTFNYQNNLRSTIDPMIESTPIAVITPKTNADLGENPSKNDVPAPDCGARAEISADGETVFGASKSGS